MKVPFTDFDNILISRIAMVVLKAILSSKPFNIHLIITPLLEIYLTTLMVLC